MTLPRPVVVWLRQYAHKRGVSVATAIDQLCGDWLGQGLDWRAAELTLRVSHETMARVEALAAEHGKPKAAVVRAALTAAHAAHKGD